MPKRASVAPWLLLWCGALAVRLLYVWQLRGSPLFRFLLGDAAVYDTWARTVAGGDWLGHETFYQAPLYPYFLAVLYRLGCTLPLGVRLVQVVLGATACLLVGRAGARFSGRGVGLLAGALLAVDPSAVYFDALVQKAVLDGFCFALVLWMLARVETGPAGVGAWLATGVALGLLGLTRENALVLVAVVLVWSQVRPRERPSRRLAVATALLGGVAVVLAPVAARNFAVGGELHVTTSQLGSQLWIGNHPGADGTYEALRWNRGNALYERDDAAALAEEAVGHALTPGEVSRYWLARSVAFIRAEPVAWLRLMLRKWLLVWNATELGDTDDQYTYADFSPLLRVLMAVLHFGVLCPLGVLGMVLAWPERRRLGLLYVLTLTYAASVALFFVFARYRQPLVPLLALFAAGGLARAWTLLRAGATRILAPAAALAAGAAVVANWPVVPAHKGSAVAYYNLGGHLAEAGDADEAFAAFRRAVALDPRLAQAHQQLGVALYRRGETLHALAEFTTAVSLNPAFADARHNQAAMFFRLRRFDDAVAAERAALAVDPGLREARDLLARALLEVDRPGDAVPELERLLHDDPDDGVLHEQLGMALAAQGRVDDAIVQYREATVRVPASADFHYNLGDALASVGRLDEARGALETALRLEPAHVQAHLDLSQVLRAESDPAGAAEHLAAAERLAPPGSAQADAVQAVKRAAAE